MGGIYISFNDQKSQDAELSIKAMALQIGLNLAIAIAVMIGFCLLRPRNVLVYAPKYKYAKDNMRPPEISHKWAAWIKPLWATTDDHLLPRIGYDAVFFIKFLRFIRTLLIVMTIIGLGALIPVNIIATKATGDWPPAPGIEFLSIADINYSNGKLVTNPNMLWYWAPFAATWLFSLAILFGLHQFTNQYRALREHYFASQTDDNAKTILVSQLPPSIRSDKQLEKWAQLLSQLGFPIKDCLLGRVNTKLTGLYDEHELAVRHLEIALASYLNDGKKVGKQRPTMRVGGFLGIGGKKVDAIEHYTKEVRDLEVEINELRHGTKKKKKSGQSKDDKPGHFAWLEFDRIKQAQGAISALNSMRKHKKKNNNNNQKDEEDDSMMDARPSPEPRDLIWANLDLSPAQRRFKRWMGRGIYWVCVFALMIPVGMLSATSNIVNVVRFLPNAAEFIDTHQSLMGIIESWFSPIVMALFFMVLPIVFRFLSKLQGYRTQTTVDQKVFLKLYIFFLFNNLLVFTLVNVFVGIYGQLRALILSGAVPDTDSITHYIVQTARNISDVSTFWINYVCVHGLGLTMQLCQLVPLVMLTLRRWLTRPSPRELREYAQPSPFDYAQTYSLLVFFFTVSLLYSAMAPLILPFALMYFTIASMVYKYSLMYVQKTDMESGARMWPVLFYAIGFAMILFHVIMLLILGLKGGSLQAYCMIPLPVLTLVFLTFYRRRLSDLNIIKDEHKWIEFSLPASFNKMAPMDGVSKPAASSSSSLKDRFRDPAVFHKLSRPMVHDDVKHLLPMVYHKKQETQHHVAMSMGRSAPLEQEDIALHTMDPHHLQLGDIGIDFCAMNEDELIEHAVDHSDDDMSDPSDIDDGEKNARFNAGGYNNNNGWHQYDDDDYDDDDDDDRRGLMQADRRPPRKDSYASSMDWQPMNRSGIISQLVGIYEAMPSQRTLLMDPEELASYHAIQQQQNGTHRLRRHHSAPHIRVSAPVQQPMASQMPQSSDTSLRRYQTTRIARPAHDAALQRRPSQPLSRQSRQLQPSALSQPQQQQEPPRPRRHSLSLDAVAAYTDRQGDWLTQLDAWWDQRRQHDTHQLTRSTTVTMPRAESRHHHHHIQRSNTADAFVPAPSPLPPQPVHQAHPGDARIRITYYDDLLDSDDQFA